MAHINLLPWREELRKERQREFFTAAGGCALVMLLVIGYAHIHITGMVEHQNTRNELLKKEIKDVEAKIQEIKDLEKQKEQLVARMKVIEQLQQNRPGIVHLFDELAKATPDGLYLTKVTQKGNEWTVEGRAESNSRLAAFMRNLDTSAWFEEPDLRVIQSATKQEDRSRVFTLTVKQSSVEVTQ